MSDMTLVDSPIGQELSLAELLGFGADESRSIADLIFAAKNGDSASMSVLGEKYLKGVDVERNIAKGLYWLAESEDERSWNEIGSFYDKEKDLDRAEEWYLKEVEKKGPLFLPGDERPLPDLSAAGKTGSGKGRAIPGTIAGGHGKPAGADEE